MEPEQGNGNNEHTAAIIIRPLLGVIKTLDRASLGIIDAEFDILKLQVLVLDALLAGKAGLVLQFALSISTSLLLKWPLQL